MSQFVQPASTRPLFIYGLVLGQRREVKEGTGEGETVGKKREKEKDLCQQMKEPSFACVSGEIKENSQRLCLTVNQALLGAAVGSGLALGGWAVGGVQSQAEHIPPQGWRWGNGPRDGSKRKQEVGNENQARAVEGER